MKKLYILLLLITPFGSFAQQTIISTQNGNASNPLTWDCFCFPGTDDNIIINHQVGMDVDWLVNNSGSIAVNSAGSLIQNGTHSLAVIGVGSELIVAGNFKMENLSITEDASATTTLTGTIRVNSALYVGGTALFVNEGSTLDVDSLLTEGTFQQNGLLMAGDVLNTGNFTLNGEMEADSLGNTGTMTFASGYTFASVFGTSGTANLLSGFIQTSGDMYNSGDFTTSSGTELECLGTFYSGDTISGTALFDHNGLLTVAVDLYFSEDVQGTGNICVAGDSYNAAAISGTLDICDATATMNGFDFNIGTVAGTITFCNPGCTVGLSEETINWNLVPNPANSYIKLIGLDGAESIQIVDLMGKTASILYSETNEFDISTLKSGAYFVVPVDAVHALPMRLIVE